MKLYESVYLNTTDKAEAVVRGLLRELAELKELVRDEDLHPVARRALQDEARMVQELVNTYQTLIKAAPKAEATPSEIPF